MMREGQEPAGAIARRPLRSLRWLLAAVVVLPLVIVAAGAWLSWREAREEAEAEMRHVAGAAAEYARRVLDSHALVLEWMNDLLAGLSDEEIRGREQELHQALARMADRRGGEQAMYLIAYGADRQPLVNSALFPVPRGAGFVSRITPQMLAPTATPEVVISPVLIGTFTGRTFFSLARPRQGSAGSAGVLNASVFTSHANAELRRLGVNAEDVLSLVRADGALLARSIGLPDPPHIPALSPILRELAKGADAVVNLGASPLDGVERLVAYRRVQGYPVYASAARPMALIRARWWAGVVAQLAIAIPTTISLLMLALLVRRQQLALSDANQRLERRVAERAAALALREAELARVQRIGRIGGFEIDLRSGRNFRSPEYMAVQGKAAAAALEQHADWVARLHPEDRDAAERCFLDAVSDHSGATDYAQEYRIVTPEGGVRWISARGEIERDAQGRALRMVGAHHDITDRKLAELAVATDRARMAALLQHLPVGIAMAEAPGGRLIYANEANRRIYGPADLPDVAASLRHHPRLRADTGQPYERPEELPIMRALQGETVVRESMRVLGADGEWHDLVVSAAPVRDAQGDITSAIAAFADLTAERAAQAALRDSEARFRGLAEAMPAIAWIADPEGRITWHSPRWHEFTGQPQDLPDWRPALHAEDAAPTAAAWQAALANDTVYEVEHRLRRRDGSWVWFLSRAMPQRDADGRVLRWFGTATDIDARRRAEALLVESENRFRALTEAMPQLVWSSPPDGQRDYFNPRWTEFTGQDAPAAMGEGWTRVVHPEDRDRSLSAWHEAVRTGEAYEVEHRLRAQEGGWRWFLARGVPVRDLHGRITRWFGTCTDVDDAVRTRQELARGRDALEAAVAARTQALMDATRQLAAEMRRREETQAALAQAQKLEALGQLTGGVAHDFNNLLMAITGSYHLLERRLPADAGLQQMVRHGRDAADRAARLVRQLLAFARREPLQAGRVEPAALLANAEGLVRQALGPRITLRIEAEEGLPAALADPQQLEVALLNLALNARDAMPRGGEVTLSARHHAGPPRRIVFALQDNGTGMPQEVLARATEPFFTTKPQGQGTGLGLAMVHGFAHQLGGRMHIESAPGAGTRVEIHLPLAEGLVSAGLEASAPVASLVPHGGAIVLLVDDDAQARPVTAAVLRDLGYAVLEAADAEAASALSLAAEAVDLLITDVMMPGTDGPALAARLRQVRPGLPVLYITGHAERSRLPADAAILEKPFAPAALAEAILQALGRGRRRGSMVEAAE